MSTFNVFDPKNYSLSFFFYHILEFDPFKDLHFLNKTGEAKNQRDAYFWCASSLGMTNVVNQTHTHRFTHTNNPRKP